MKKYTGVISSHWETGFEGITWILIPDENIEKAFNVIFIKEGDHLKIFSEEGEVLFEGIIQEDRETGWQEYKGNPDSGLGTPVAFGYYIEWTQRSWSPENWARLFMKEDLNEGSPLKAELIKKDE